MTVPTKAVEAFKAAWQQADAEGREGSRVEAGLAAALPFLDDPEDERPHVNFDLAAEIDGVHIETTVTVRYPRNHGADAARIIFEGFQNDQTFVQLLMMLAERGDASAVGLLMTTGFEAVDGGVL